MTTQNKKRIAALEIEAHRAQPRGDDDDMGIEFCRALHQGYGDGSPYDSNAPRPTLAVVRAMIAQVWNEPNEPNHTAA